MEAGWGGLDRHLTDRRAFELGKKRVARWPLMDDGRIAEANVDRGRSRYPVERPVERLDAIAARLLGPRLHIGLVDLHDVGAGGEQVLDLGIDSRRIVERQLLLVPVEIVLR